MWRPAAIVGLSPSSEMTARCAEFGVATKPTPHIGSAVGVCGPYRCWWRPNYYAYGPGNYYGPRFYGYAYGSRPFYRFGYRGWG
jgi:hypothetical protein